MTFVRRLPVELISWTFALVLLAFLKPGSTHFTICPLGAFGIGWCPGCGLGRSISSLLHGDVVQSIRYHWFGIPALLILCHRILILSKNYIKSLYIFN